MSAIEQKFAKRHYFFWVTLFFAAIMLGSYIFFLSLLFRYGTYEKDLGWKSSPSGNFYVISEITPSSDALGKLEIGDKILAVNDDNSIQKNYILLNNLNKIIRSIPQDSAYTIDISRNSIPYRFTLTCKTKRNYEQLGILITFFLCSLVFSICGFLISILRPEKKLTRKLGLVFFFTSAFMLAIGIRMISPFLAGADYLFYLMLSLSYPTLFPLGYAAYLEFPPGVAQSRFWNSINYFFVYI
jgi:hypothetical protein